MENDILEQFQAQDHKIDAIYESVEKTRKYFMWTLIATLVAFFLPLIGLVFAIPYFLNTLSSAYGL
jgi:competence protein ComGF